MTLKQLISAALILSFANFTYAAELTDVRTTPLKGTIALTFDDGPTAEFTPQILAILKQYNIKATFFIVGINAQNHPEIVREAFEAGHAIDNHSLTHPMLTKLSNKELAKEIEEPALIVKDITGERTPCLRFPFGASNQHVVDAIHQHGMAVAPMGLNAYDYKRPGVDKIVKRVLDNIKAGDVLIMHDGFSEREQTVAALPRIIEGIQKKGLGFSLICAGKSAEPPAQ